MNNKNYMGSSIFIINLNLGKIPFINFSKDNNPRMLINDKKTKTIFPGTNYLSLNPLLPKISKKKYILKPRADMFTHNEDENNNINKDKTKSNVQKLINQK